MKLNTLLFLSVLAVPVFAQQDKTLVDNTVSKTELESDMRFIASDELRGRDTGSPEIRIASQFIANRFRSIGVQPVMEEGSYFQKVPMSKEKQPSNATFSFMDKKFNHGDEMLVMTGDDGNTEGSIEYVGYGMPSELGNKDLKGKIVVSLIGSGEGDDIRSAIGLSGQKRIAAMESGAVAFVELYKSGQVPWSLIVNYMGRDRIRIAEDTEGEVIPSIYINDGDGKLKEMFESGSDEKANLTIEGKESLMFDGRNVVGVIEGTDPVLKNEFIALTAHYDHVGVNKNAAPGEDNIYNGARDNGMGTVTLMAAAKHFSLNPPKRSVLLVAFTGEEKGLLGSEWFVQNSPIDMKQVIFNLNVDNAGYSDTSLVTVIGLGRTTADPMIKSACEEYGISAIADPAPEQNLFDRSDNVNFAKLGVPAPTYSGGFEAFDDKINKYYHQVTDGPDTIDYDYLLNYASGFVLSARMIANGSERPFWVEGDKYEEAGKQLYGISSR